jgi:hypothetical protein
MIRLETHVLYRAADTPIGKVQPFFCLLTILRNREGFFDVDSCNEVAKLVFIILANLQTSLTVAKLCKWMLEVTTAK